MKLDTLAVTVSDYIAIVSFARPPVNAQNNRLREEMQLVMDSLGDRPDVRAIILTGEGKTFSAGADLSERPTQDPGHYPAHNRRVRAAFDCILECPKPVIAAVNGAAIGAGCVSALCCDILIFSEKGYLQMTEVNVGLAGGVAHVRRHLGESDARLMLLTGRRFHGPDLVKKGVASACVAPEALMETALEVARDIAKASPSAVRAAKAAFLLTENLSVYEGYRYEQGNTMALSTSADTAEAMAAFREKRPPVFKP